MELFEKNKVHPNRHHRIEQYGWLKWAVLILSGNFESKWNPLWDPSFQTWFDTK